MKTPREQLAIGDNGWCRGATHLASPNHDARPAGVAPYLLVIHNISLPPGQFGSSDIADLFLNRLDYDAHPYFDALRHLRVSAHFLIRRDGSLFQFVSADDRAWHAGASSFGGREACNDFSIGVELEGTDTEAFTPLQYDRLLDLTHALRLHYPLTDVTGHEQIAPGRKTDPGPHFDWSTFCTAFARRFPNTPTAMRFPSG